MPQPEFVPIDDDACPSSSIMEVAALMTKRWTGGILLALSRDLHRFSEIQNTVQGISGRMVSARLRELEQHGLVRRVVTPTMPVSVSYFLTHKGRVALASLQNLALVGYGIEDASSQVA